MARHTATVTDREQPAWGQHDAWPPARLRIATPRLELRLPGEDELARLAAVAAAGVHMPGEQPFGIPWGAQPPALRARSVLQWHWATRGTWMPQRWTLDFAVFLDGEPVGVQGLSAAGFPVRREVATGSWLGLPHQRQGLGKEMRAAVLVLAFTHLGALSAVTGAFADNTAAIKVSKALGYHDDGHQVTNRDGARVLAHRFRLTAHTDMRHWPPVTISGIDEELLGMCGATDPAGHQALPLGGYPHA
jgi:RimJ/RimL family protein N-acetyltransferase